MTDDEVLITVRDAVYDIADHLLLADNIVSDFTLHNLDHHIDRKFLAASIEIRHLPWHEMIFQYEIYILKDDIRGFVVKTTAEVPPIVADEPIVANNMEEYIAGLGNKVIDYLDDISPETIYLDFINKTTVLTEGIVHHYIHAPLDHHIYIWTTDGEQLFIDKSYTDLFEIAKAAINEVHKLINNHPKLSTQRAIKILKLDSLYPTVIYDIEVFDNNYVDPIYSYEIHITVEEETFYYTGFDVTQRPGDQNFDDIEEVNKQLRKLRTKFNLETLEPHDLILDCLRKFTEAEKRKELKNYSEN